MEFKGTKGKWYVSQPNGKSICAESDNAIGYEVVVVQDGFMSKYSQTAKANALLASKAPEMLRMLIGISKTAEKIWEIEQDNPFFDEIDFAELDDLIQSATELK